MMRRLGLLIVLGLAVTLGSTTVQSPLAKAAPKPLSSAVLGVSPALETLVGQPKQQSLSYQLTVTNNSSRDLPVTVTASDFTSLGTNGTPAFLGPGQYSPAHSLARSLVSDVTAFTLAAHSSRQLTVQVQPLAGLTAGGHYGALLFQTTAGGSVANNSRNPVSLKQTVASLVFLTTNGQGSYHLEVAPQSGSLRLFSLPSQLNQLFSNTGNVQTTPRGYVNLTGPFGKQVAKGIINPDSALVLPGTKRLLQTSLASTGHAFWPGIYTLTVFYRADTAASFTPATSHFLYLGWPIVIFIIFVFILAIIGRQKHIFSTRKRSS